MAQIVNQTRFGAKTKSEIRFEIPHIRRALLQIHDQPPSQKSAESALLSWKTLFFRKDFSLRAGAMPCNSCSFIFLSTFFCHSISRSSLTSPSLSGSSAKSVVSSSSLGCRYLALPRSAVKYFLPPSSLPSFPSVKLSSYGVDNKPA
jgi:hypothetical protein